MIKILVRAVKFLALKSAPLVACLPAGFRRFLFSLVFQVDRLPKAGPLSAALLESLRSHGDIPGINIVGYVRAALGIGESARLCAATAQAGGIPFSISDISMCCRNAPICEEWDKHIRLDNPYPFNIIHATADQVPITATVLGHRFFKDRYNIGYWHWELPEFPSKWASSFDPFHEIWTGSRFAQKAVAAKSPVPVHCIPLPIALPALPKLTRDTFQLPDDQFLFLVMFDVSSTMERKNPEAALAAFLTAFAGRKEVGLVIKMQNGDAEPERFKMLRDLVAQHANCHLINQALTRPEVFALENICDAFVSLHRSEGFGLCLAECMALGKPVVGTGWSGNMDFMNGDNSCPVDFELVRINETVGPYEIGQTWANPDANHAADLMVKLVEDVDYRQAIGRCAAQTIRRDLSFEAVGRLYRERLTALSEDRRGPGASKGGAPA